MKGITIMKNVIIFEAEYTEVNEGTEEAEG